MFTRRRRELEGATQQLYRTLVSYEAAKPFSEIPSPKGLPVLGNLLNWTRNQKNFTAYHKSLKDQLGPIYAIRMPGKVDDLIFITDTDDIRTMYAKDGLTPFMASFKVLEKARKEQLKSSWQGGPGLASQGQEWLDFRQRIQQDMMRPKSALFYIDDLADIVDELIAKLMADCNAQGETQNVAAACAQYGLEAIGKMFLGSNLGAIQEKEDGVRMIEAVKRFFTVFTPCLAIPEKLLPYSKKYKIFCECQQTMYDIVKRNLDLAMARDKVDGSLSGTILERLLTRNGGDSTVPIIMAVDSLAAGIDTTGNATTMLLYDLSTNPAKQETLYQEILSVVGPTGKMTEAGLASMRYLKACVTESLRLRPVIHITSRHTQEDMVLCGYQIPKGSMVVRNNALTTSDAKYFNSPDTFTPERWLRDSPQREEIDAFSSLPFGFGPRGCVGQRFARLELQMVAFKIVQKYKLEYNGEPIHMEYIGLGTPSKDVNIKLVPRQQ